MVSKEGVWLSEGKGVFSAKTVKILEKLLNDLIVCNRCTDLAKQSTEQQVLYFEGN